MGHEDLSPEQREALSKRGIEVPQKFEGGPGHPVGPQAEHLTTGLGTNRPGDPQPKKEAEEPPKKK